LGIRAATIYQRYKKQMTIKEILHAGPIVRPREISIKYRCKTQTIDKWAKELNMSEELIYGRYRSKLSAEKIFSVNRLTNREAEIYIKHQGKTRTIPEWSKITGLKKHTIHDRYSKGWSSKEILKKIPARNKSQPSQIQITHEGQTYSIPEWAKTTGIKEGTIRARVSKGFQTSEILSKTPLSTVTNKGVKDPKKYIKLYEEYKKGESIIGLARKHQMSDVTIKRNFDRLGLSSRNRSDSILIGFKKNKKAMNAKKSIKVKARLLEMDYELIDEYRGQDYRSGTKFLGRKQYKIRHILCGTYFEDDVFAMPRCPKCFRELNHSYQEDLFQKILIDNKVEFESNVRNLVNVYGDKKRNHEIDVYLPQMKIGFEIDSLAWHHSKPEKHSRKTELALAQGIKLFHIWTFFHKKKVESFVKSQLGIGLMTIQSKKTDFVTLTELESKEFLRMNSLFEPSKSHFQYALLFQGSIVGLICFKKRNKNTIILESCCFKQGFHVVGLKTMLHQSIPLIKEFGYSKIVAFEDRDLMPDHKDSLYFHNGFEFKGDIGNKLFYTDRNKFYPREMFQAHKLQHLFENYDPLLTPEENRANNKILPVWNSGNWKFELKI
jgi:hypothetical protein